MSNFSAQDMAWLQYAADNNNTKIYDYVMYKNGIGRREDITPSVDLKAELARIQQNPNVQKYYQESPVTFTDKLVKNKFTPKVLEQYLSKTPGDFERPDDFVKDFNAAWDDKTWQDHMDYVNRKQAEKESAVDWWTGKSAESVQEAQEAATRSQITAEAAASQSKLTYIKQHGGSLEKALASLTNEIASGFANKQNIALTKWLTEEGAPMPEFTVEVGDGKSTSVPGTDINVPAEIRLGTPTLLEGAPEDYNPKGGSGFGDPSDVGHYYAAHPDQYMPEVPKVPTLYDGNKVDMTVTPMLGDIDTTSIFDKSKFEQLPTALNAQEITQEQQSQNNQTFDQVKRAGSFEIKTSSDRPFGGPALEKAFVETPLQSFGDVGSNKKGNTVFRWA